MLLRVRSTAPAAVASAPPATPSNVEIKVLSISPTPVSLRQAIVPESGSRANAQ
ncbi:hypothetical protein GCM10010448_67200 [Streptomyces glomeratus]|uniref:FXSXX-COOH protein n=1 Tax=Streptomyces glomeratus TaxID=284452 RepID=A0ABP6M5Z3_9ACTN